MAASRRQASPFAANALRRLRLRHIELLVELGQAATVRAAAEALNLSQPAVSKMLAEIEAVAAATLFHRSRRGTEPTPAGWMLIEYARSIDQHLRNAGDSLDAIVDGHGQLLRIGSFSTTAIVPMALTLLQQTRPELLVRIRENPPLPLIRDLLAARLDAVVCALPTPLPEGIPADRLKVESLAADELCVVVSPDHRLAGRRTVGWRDLVDEAWALPPPDAMMRQALAARMLQQGLVPPRPTVESLSAITMRWLVRYDPQKVGVMRLHQAREESAMGFVRILPVRPAIPLPDISLITRRETCPADQAIGAFAASLRQAARRRDLLKGIPGLARRRRGRAD